MANETTEEIVELSVTDGIAFVEQSSPLTRLHYFDGKFLRADAFATEQDYHRARVRLANIAGGWGVVHGLEIALRGGQLAVSAGLAITPAGSLVLATSEMRADLAKLLQLNQREAATPGSAAFGDCSSAPKAGVKEGAPQAIYEITVGPVEGLCGNEAVFGKLCESACATDSRHPYWREGVVLRLRPRTLVLPTSSAVPISAVHLRNRVASAYFALEPGQPASQVSASGLAGDVWCGGAALYGRDEVVIGLLVREGGSTRVIDAWSGRRERMDAQARSYWQGRMAMRPWAVFIAQILQFQCQLSGALEPGGGGFTAVDDCDRIRLLLDRTRRELEALTSRWRQTGQQLLLKSGDLSKKQMTEVDSHVNSTYAEIGQLSQELAVVEAGTGALPVQRMLIAAGFLDLPPAGYLPVAPGKVALDLQLQRMFGEGVNLQLHAVAEDEIAHLLEEAQHMRRISLTRGIDDPKLREPVEIFVPEGRRVDAKAPAAGEWWQVVVQPEWANGVPQAKAENTPKVAPAAQAAKAASAKTAAKASAKTAAGAAAAGASQTTDPAGAPSEASAARLNIDLGDVLNGKTRIRIPGLVRTHLLDDGHPAISLVLAQDPDDGASSNASRLINQKAADGNADNTSSASAAAWLAADIGADPFDLPVGGDTSARAEVRAAIARLAITLGASATITLLAREGTPRAGLRLRLQVDAVMHSKIVATSGVRSVDKSDSGSLRITLERDGDARSGRLVVDEDPMNLADGAGVLHWRETPREAVLELVFQIARKIVDGSVKMMRAAAHAAAPASDSAGPSPVIDEQRISASADSRATDLLTLRLARASGLAAMPAPASAIGTAALNALAFIADASDDAAFLVRARRRLFPTLDQPAVQTVRASLDWVMFRRARTPLCGPACTTPTATGLEAVLVWHLEVPDQKSLDMLKKALDQGDTQALGSFKFRRVGILRYRDESTRPEESMASVLSMWTAAQPAAQVVLGRAWEAAPATGQGWQNHFRLREMLGLIKTLTLPPPRGDGALAAIRSPGTPLDDGALDGGMLVVTQGKTDVPPPEPVLKPHLALMVPSGFYIKIKSALKSNTAAGRAEAWNVVQSLIANAGETAPVQFLVLNFPGGSLAAADASALARANAQQRTVRNDLGFIILTLRLDAKTIASSTDAAARHRVVGDAAQAIWSPPPQGSDDGTVTLDETDLGSGAQSLSLVSYEPVVEIG